MKALHVMLFGLLLSISGCSVKQTIQTSTPYLITIKTQEIALLDTGFLNRAKHYTQLQIFSAGNVLFNLEMQDTMCLDGKCFDKLDFNKRFFGAEYYAELMQDIVDKKPLYGGKNQVMNANGFSQEIISDEAKITYKVEGDDWSFKESTKGILIRFKALPLKGEK